MNIEKSLTNNENCRTIGDVVRHVLYVCMYVYVCVSMYGGS